MIKSIRQIRINGAGKTEEYLECYPDDGSIWECDKDGNNWKQIKLNDVDLEKKFKKFVGDVL